MQIELPEEIAAAVAEIARQTGQDVGSLVAEMVTEAVKMRRVPGILFADGPTGRQARVGGTGIEVFEVIDAYEVFGQDRTKLERDLPQLAPHQLDAALAYYAAYPEEIRARLHTDAEDIAAIEALWREIPQTSPHWRGRRADAASQSPATSRESA